jgi:hypothetical protein
MTEVSLLIKFEKEFFKLVGCWLENRYCVMEGICPVPGLTFDISLTLIGDNDTRAEIYLFCAETLVEFQ